MAEGLGLSLGLHLRYSLFPSTSNAIYLMHIDLPFVWVTLLLLGIFHGINPGMGWLFAVALGLQEQRRKAVWRALLPLALGHALAIGCAILMAGLIGLVIPLTYLKWGVAGLLLSLGVFHLIRHWHPRFGGMKVSLRDLTIWSFLMASAHGAGLMVLPFLFGPTGMAPTTPHEAARGANAHSIHSAMPMPDPGMISVNSSEHGAHANHVTSLLGDLPAEPLVGLLATLVHTLGYLLVIGLVAVIVYEKLGLRLLRKAWVNLDLIWAGTLIATALVSLLA